MKYTMYILLVFQLLWLYNRGRPLMSWWIFILLLIVITFFESFAEGLGKTVAIKEVNKLQEENKKMRKILNIKGSLDKLKKGYY